jgi:hypothetical protein
MLGPNTTFYLSNIKSCMFQMTNTAYIRLITKIRIKRKYSQLQGGLTSQPAQICVISGFYHNVNDICALLGY